MRIFIASLDFSSLSSLCCLLASAYEADHSLRFRHYVDFENAAVWKLPKPLHTYCTKVQSTPVRTPAQLVAQRQNSDLSLGGGTGKHHEEAKRACQSLCHSFVCLQLHVPRRATVQRQLVHCTLLVWAT